MYFFNQPTSINTIKMSINTTEPASKLIIIFFSNVNDRSNDFSIISRNIIAGQSNLIMNVNSGVQKGAFISNHVEAILVGIEVEPDKFANFAVSNLNTILYD